MVASLFILAIVVPAIALVASFLILLIEKLGWRERVQTFGPEIISKMFNCDFCLSFWVCVVLSFLFFTFVQTDWIVLLYPFMSSPIVRKLL